MTIALLLPLEVTITLLPFGGSSEAAGQVRPGHKLQPALNTATGAHLTVLHTFVHGSEEGKNPNGSLVSDGQALYGMTSLGGTEDLGLVFKINPDGSGYQKLHDFNGEDGAHPLGPLLVLDGPVLYGVTYTGGGKDLGVIFKMNPDGSGYQKLHDFNGNNGKHPSGSLMSDGQALYGMTSSGGTGQFGVIFKINPDGSGYQKLRDFNDKDGKSPGGSFILDGQVLYGVTRSGGSNDLGVIFKINPDGSGYQKLHDFNGDDGAYPQGPLLSLDGQILYGTAYKGGSSDLGVIFKVNPDGSGYGKLHDFNGEDGAIPSGSLILDGQVLYGMTIEGGSNVLGVIFKVNPDGSGYGKLHDFNGEDGALPSGSVMSDGQGLYGMTINGGTRDKGVVFRLDITPGQAALVSPIGAIVTNSPTYRWYAVSKSTWYHLWVEDGSGVRFNEWYPSSSAGCANGTGACSVTPDMVVGGTIKWWIQTWNVAGDGPWSAPMSFTAPSPTEPGKAALVSPQGVIGFNLPTFIWNAVPNSTRYYLWVDDSSGTRITQWYTASQAGCPGGLGTCSVAPGILVGGACKWWIQTWNQVGDGPWSDAVTFTAPVPIPPGKALLVSPDGPIGTNLPTYIWEPVQSATWYYLWVDDANGVRIKQWYKADDAGCSGSSALCQATPPVPVKGSSEWWIQSWSAVGEGPWSTPLSFDAPVLPAPAAATLVEPSGSIDTPTPTYVWNAASNSTWYYLWVDDAAGPGIKQWYSIAQANCPSGTGQCSVNPGIGLVGPFCKWWIQTWSYPGGPGPWSAPTQFVIQKP
jgi:uncharacterized repeat protein (TIGR03803 family)